jgi:ribonuclease PH
VSRPDGRAPGELRPVAYELGYQEWADGSVLFSMGKTRVLCAATLAEETPRWLRGTGRGWVTGEYSMLPASTMERSARPFAASRTWIGSASGWSRWIATSSRRTPARGRRR